MIASGRNLHNRARHLGAAAALALALLSGDLIVSEASERTAAAPAADIADEVASRRAAFPLTVQPGRRYIEDAAGRPFLIHGDTAWSLIAQLTREDAELYLEDRRARGFNTLLVSLLERRFASNSPANIYGDPPFLTPGDYATPNERYFAHADWVLRRAREKGFLVLLTPSYMGAGGGPEGWYREMAANGLDKLREYGRYLGRRYAGADNIIWVHGGDYNPPDRALAEAIVEGIQEESGAPLHTAHCSSETAAYDYWRDAPWLVLNSVYTYGPVHAAALRQHARAERKPFILIESAYEYEHGATERRVRTQAYQALLSGAAGHIFGNNPIWHFDGPGLYISPVTWRQALGDRGSVSMMHLRTLMTSLPWWRLEPDADNTVLIGGLGSVADRAVAARSDDGSFALIYLPSLRTVAVQLAALAGPRVIARWYDPSDGSWSEVDEAPMTAQHARTFVPPGRNKAGFGDWVLLLQSHP